MAVKEYGGIIIIGSKGKDENMPIEERAERYVFAILKSLQPANFQKYLEEIGGIKIQLTLDKLPLTEYILSFFKSLWVEEIKEREWKKIKVNPPDGNPYELEVLEITLGLHPKLRR